MASKRDNEPHRINSTTWFYRNPKSITFVIECRDVNGWTKTIQFTVQLRTLLPKRRKAENK